LETRSNGASDDVLPMNDKQGVPSPSGEHPPSVSEKHQDKSRQRHRFWRCLGLIVLGLVLVLAIGRAVRPWAVRHYVNRTLDRNLLYCGKIAEVQIHLWRGAYSIHDIQVSKILKRTLCFSSSGRRWSA
jgi:hypothetical protein